MAVLRLSVFFMLLFSAQKKIVARRYKTFYITKTETSFTATQNRGLWERVLCRPKLMTVVCEMVRVSHQDSQTK